MNLRRENISFGQRSKIVELSHRLYKTIHIYILAFILEISQPSLVLSQASVDLWPQRHVALE